MASQQLDDERIFHTARLIPAGEAREDYLDQICSGDLALRERVEALLAVHEQEQSFLKSGGDQQVAATVDLSAGSQRPGATIGRYRLMEQIGEGGMGTVFVAQQDRPIRRKVALKVIKPGMDTKAVVARFEAERQALAMMDHPNIAKVLDAGTTEGARPFFAMELVKGVPITDYCDRNRLSIKERLELFVPVCHAIQHAHQKGIIHRDVKPSNVLVTLHDGKPVPKVIDFGVAKALNARLTDKTIYTEHLQIVGTLLYMSPEQAELSGLDVDTRSDIYSLGVLLYELLTGTTPFQKVELDQAGFDEQRRIIRDEEPPRASVRVSSLGETATAVAEQRKTDPKKLHQVVRGDLDWIALKAMEKDRTRRYDTAVALADEVEHFLNDEPVIARPPTTPYRVSKYCRRNRVAIAVMAILSLGLLVTSWQTFRAETEAARARKARQELEVLIRQLRTEILERAFSFAFAGDLFGVEEALTKAKLANSGSDVIAAIQGIAFLYAGRPDEATKYLDVAVEKDPASLVAVAAASWAHMDAGNIETGNELFERTQELARNQESTDDYTRMLVIQSRIYGSQDLNALIAEMDELARNHNRWGIPYAIRAMLKTRLGQRTLDMNRLEDAIADFEIANKYLPDNTFVLNAGMDAHNYAIQLASHLGLDTAEIERRGHMLCEQIEPWKGRLYLRSERASFYKLTEQDERFAAERKALLGAGIASPQPELAKLLLEGNNNELLAFASSRSTVTPRIAVAIHHALDGEIDRALELHSHLERENIATNTRLLMLDILCIAQRPEEAKLAAERILERLESGIAPSLWWLEPTMVEFMAERVTQEELLEVAGPFNLERSCAAWSIAMKHLANGQVELARPWLLEAADCAGTGWWSTEFSRAYLQLIESNKIRPASP